MAVNLLGKLLRLNFSRKMGLEFPPFWEHQSINLENAISMKGQIISPRQTYIRRGLGNSRAETDVRGFRMKEFPEKLPLVKAQKKIMETVPIQTWGGKQGIAGVLIRLLPNILVARSTLGWGIITALSPSNQFLGVFNRVEPNGNWSPSPVPLSIGWLVA